MLLTQICVNLVLFFVGVFGILFNRQSVLIVLMCIEIVLLSANLNFLIFSIYLDDSLGQIFSLLILTVAAAESAIGISILIIYYRIKGNISINEVAVLKG